MISTALTRMLGIEHPIIQAGMASEAGAALASAVSNAGALGSLGGIGRDPASFAAEIAACRGLTSRPFAVNIPTFDWAPFARELVDVAVKAAVPVITLSFGRFDAALAQAKAAGITTTVQVQDMDGLRRALAGRADAVIVQGTEAGGHTGRRGTLGFAAQALEIAGDVPIVVAGGIATGRALAGVLAMGAAGAVMGTRFKASDEFGCAPALKEAVVASDGDHTYYGEVVDIPFPFTWPAGIAGRILANRFTAEWHGREDALRAEVAAGATPDAFLAALQEPDRVLNWAGESSGLVSAVMPAAAIVAEVAAEAEAYLRKAAGLVR
ncbi:MAG: nitronate monooxygenase [Chloroflexi bacterium]|nr:nitronate monooxygenase [Chloroflexota bacterium]